MLIEVCERWPIEVTTDTTDPDWFGARAAHLMADTSHRVAMNYEVIQAAHEVAPKVHGIVEPFAGVGAQTLIARSLWPALAGHHVRTDISLAAVQHHAYLDRTGLLPPMQPMTLADGYAVDCFERGDLALLDFGDLTALKLVGATTHHALLERAFSANVAAVVTTDIAGRYLHFHRDTYGKALRDTITDYPSYIRAVAAYVAFEWGYYAAVTVWRPWSSKTVYLPAPQPHELRPYRKSVVGLRSLEPDLDDLL